MTLVHYDRVDEGKKGGILKAPAKASCYKKEVNRMLYDGARMSDRTLDFVNTVLCVATISFDASAAHMNYVFPRAKKKGG